MRKKIGILSLVLLLTATANAQRHQLQRNKDGLNHTPEQIATLQSKRMALALDLDQKQLDAVYKLMKKNANEREKLRKERQNGNKQDKSQRFNLQNSYLDKQIEHKSEMKKILNDEQFQKWGKMRAQKNRKRNSQRKNKTQSRFKSCNPKSCVNFNTQG